MVYFNKKYVIVSFIFVLIVGGNSHEEFSDLETIENKVYIEPETLTLSDIKNIESALNIIEQENLDFIQKSNISQLAEVSLEEALSATKESFKKIKDNVTLLENILKMPQETINIFKAFLIKINPLTKEYLTVFYQPIAMIRIMFNSPFKDFKYDFDKKLIIDYLEESNKKLNILNNLNQEITPTFDNELELFFKKRISDAQIGCAITLMTPITLLYIRTISEIVTTAINKIKNNQEIDQVLLDNATKKIEEFCEITQHNFYKTLKSLIKGNERLKNIRNAIPEQITELNELDKNYGKNEKIHKQIQQLIKVVESLTSLVR